MLPATAKGLFVGILIILLLFAILGDCFAAL